MTDKKTAMRDKQNWMNIRHRINEWFHTTGNWVTRCSIISTDFFDESEIVRYCWSATSMKAVYGHALHDREGSGRFRLALALLPPQEA